MESSRPNVYFDIALATCFVRVVRFLGREFADGSRRKWLGGDLGATVTTREDTGTSNQTRSRDTRDTAKHITFQRTQNCNPNYVNNNRTNERTQTPILQHTYITQQQSPSECHILSTAQVYSINTRVHPRAMAGEGTSTMQGNSSPSESAS
jgi:hypothetical protein